MRITIITLIIFLFPSVSFAQENIIKQDYKNNISFVRLDSTYKSQSTIVEYDNFLVLLELPAIEKSSQREKGLETESKKGQVLIDYLKKQYNKPIKYIFSSHWHYHSLSGILPFLQAGSKIVTTSKNWEISVKKGILEPNDLKKYSSNIITIDKDTTFLADTKYLIDVVYLNNGDVYYHPTDDYLLFYLKKDKIIHASCLAWIKDLDYNTVKTYTYNSRLDGFFRVLEDKKLKPKSIIRLEHNTLGNPKEVRYVYSAKEIKDIMSNAVSTEEEIEHYINLDEKILETSMDSLINEAIAKQLHPNLLRIAALENLKSKNYSRATKLALFLNLYYPGITKYIDILGECYFAAGDYEKALYYDNHLSKFSDKYGIKKWQSRKWKD